MSLHERRVHLSRIAFVAAVLAVLLAGACSDDGDLDGSRPATLTPAPATATSEAPAPSAGSPAAPPSGGPTVSPTPESPSPEAPATGLVPVNVERVFGELAFERMTGLYQDAAGSWYVTEQQGRIFRIDGVTGEPALFLDITDRVDDSGSEMGLLGFALSPEFETSHEFYVDYTGGGQTVVSRFAASDDHSSADPGSEQVLLTVDQPYSNHNGGQIAFGPDGFLYIGLGDGGGGNDQQGNGQNLGTLLAAILRIDVSGGGDYSVPVDNPFVGQAGARGEIWAYGLRNPWRFSFDAGTGELWVGDVGQNTREEIDLVVRGGNYGWNVMEGFVCRGGGSGCDTEGLLVPVFDYVTGSGGTCSVTGGFVYRGSAIPALRGAYVFSDYCSGGIYGLRAVDGVLTEQAELASPGLNVSSLAQDNDGELYVLDLGGGGIYKIVP